MDDFEKWREEWHRICGWTTGPEDGMYTADSLLAAYEAGQASRDAELGELRRKCGQLIEQVAALKVRLAATTPVIEAAERRYGDLDETPCVHGNITWNCESCDSEKDEAIVAALATYRAAVTKDGEGIQPYGDRPFTLPRRTVIEDDQKPSQEEGK